MMKKCLFLLLLLPLSLFAQREDRAYKGNHAFTIGSGGLGIQSPLTNAWGYQLNAWPMFGKVSDEGPLINMYGYHLEANFTRRFMINDRWSILTGIGVRSNLITYSRFVDFENRFMNAFQVPIEVEYFPFKYAPNISVAAGCDIVFPNGSTPYKKVRFIPNASLRFYLRGSGKRKK